MYGHVLWSDSGLPKALRTYVAGRSGQYQDSSLEESSRPDHTNNLHHIHQYNWYSLLQHMILR